MSMKWIRRALVAIGSLMLCYAAVNAVMSPDMRFTYVRFLAFVLIGHELILMPAAVGCGVLIGRIIPGTARPVVQAATFASAVVIAIALPVVTGHGRSPDLPSALPRDYTRGLLLILAAIWAAALTALIVRRIRHPRVQGIGTQGQP